jgi:hypothetical protein
VCVVAVAVAVAVAVVVVVVVNPVMFIEHRRPLRDV